MVDKRKSSDYGTLRGLVPQSLIKQFKVFCLENDLDNSEGLEKILVDYFKQLESQNLPHASDSEQLAIVAETIAEIVQQNYYGLLSDGKIQPDNLQKIAEGEEPSKADVYRIASLLHVEAQDLLALRDRTFRSKRKEPNGAH